LRALSASILSTLETMSNEESAMSVILADRRVKTSASVTFQDGPNFRLLSFVGIYPQTKDSHVVWPPNASLHFSQQP
jgi:hypothetical protein